MQTQMRRVPRVQVVAAAAADADEVAAFLRSLPAADARLRFGGRPDWLIERLFHEAQRGATIARIDGEMVGMVDYAFTACGVEIGVVVASPHRRRGIASALLTATLARLGPAVPVIAYASRENVPAVRWLRKHGFVGRAATSDPVLFARSAAQARAS
jgi:ribosomal protein S18 acetylase RimI-like enzyme